MLRRLIAFGGSVATLLANFAPAAEPYSVPPTDAPELAAIGRHKVGWQTVTFTHPHQPDIPALVGGAGIAGVSDRALKVDIWYPAQLNADAKPAIYRATLPRSKASGEKSMFAHTALAVRDAAPLQGAKFPLVVVSHGFGGWGTSMSYLTENIASKGYVVASIDHGDASANDMRSFMLSFGSAVVHRAKDQQFVVEQLRKMSGDSSRGPLGSLIDASAVGLVGYSMGGFGALATAGAAYDLESKTFALIPATAKAPLAPSAAESAPHLKALILIAPWGAQPTQRSWTTASLAQVKTPTLLVVGDQDDVVEYNGGVRYLFEHMKGAPRHLLVYENARHNTGGNPPPAESFAEFLTREYFDEPVWRKDRLNAINQHFVTAFLDKNLKGEEAKGEYLALASPRSNEGSWPLDFGQLPDRAHAAKNGISAGYWRGFQRRWAVGMQFQSRPAEQ